jgi:hypothetical protein
MRAGWFSAHLVFQKPSSMLKNPCDLHRTASAAPLGPIFMRFTGVQSPKMAKFGLRGVVSDPSGTAPWEFFNKLPSFLRPQALQDFPVRLLLHVRPFFCFNSSCPLADRTGVSAAALAPPGQALWQTVY